MANDYTIDNIDKILGGELLNDEIYPGKISQLLIDSRQVVFPLESLFFALGGKRKNGHDFIADLYQIGVRNFVISKTKATKQDKPYNIQHPEANFVLVKNTVAALQRLAAHHRAQYQLNTIGITGSNGKTIVKEWLFQLLRNDTTIVRSPKSYNSQIGVPLSVWQIRKGDELGIFEAGISQPGEMDKLAPIIQANIGLITNIGDAHSEGFVSPEAKTREKLKLFAHADTIIYCADHAIIDELVKEIYPYKNRLCWSRQKPSDLAILKTEKIARKYFINYKFQGKVASFQLDFTDAAGLENALHCLAVLCYFGYTPSRIREQMAQLEPVAMRLKLKQGINRCTLINDSYNSDFSSVNIALNFLEQQSAGKKRSIIISDILQSKGDKDALYQKLGEMLSEKKLNRVIAVGKAIRMLASHLPGNIIFQHYKNTKSLLQELEFDQLRDEVILIKGARRFNFEKITARLSQQIHNTVLEVKLDALMHNLQVYTNQLEPTTKMMVMVKASAYGSGSVEVARLLENSRVDYLTVAYADEGIELRNAGIQLPILVLNPEEAVFESIQRFRLEPEIYSISLLKKFINFLPPELPPYPVHLKLDTGLNRLGFTEEDIPELSKLLKSGNQLIVKSIFSHLAGSGNPQHDDFTRHQWALYNKMADKISRALAYSPLRHLLNSAGILRFPQYQLNMVRLGIGLYGIDGSGEVQEKLQTVHSLKARISQIKNVAPNETIGYNRHGIARQAMRIAVVSIGYADGLMRQAGNGNFSVLLHGKKAPIVGDVCMDMCMVDISHIPAAREGDIVEIFGEKQPVRQLAKACRTIPYEIFTGISDRVRRVYFLGEAS